MSEPLKVIVGNPNETDARIAVRAAAAKTADPADEFAQRHREILDQAKIDADEAMLRMAEKGILFPEPVETRRPK